MPTVQTTVWINAPRDKVYEIAKDNRSFPEFMKDVQSLTVVEEKDNRVVSDYVGIVSSFGLKVRWQQEDIWDDTAYTCVFRQIKGDYDQLDGVWNFIEENGGTRFDSVVNYEYVVPGLGPLVKKVVHNIVIKNMDGVLGAIKDRSEK
jgi:uncharacterized membrane protein